MSAFLCSEKHINVLVSYGAHHDASVYIPGPSGRWFWQSVKLDPTLIANILTTANVEALHVRYGDDHVGSAVKYKPEATSHMSPVSIIKLCDCFNYQASEVKDYEGTPAAKIIDSIRNTAIDHLPGYNDAAWSI